MPSAVDICNLALSHLGDTAAVADITLPDPTVQAELCARFYPMCRDALLEAHRWTWATKRVRAAQLTSEWPEWAYAYARPADVLGGLEVLPPMPAAGVYPPQPFECEVNGDDAVVIYTNQPEAVLRYTRVVEDPTRFSPLFVTTLTWRLAAALAGPILKGEAGATEAKRCEQMAQAYLSRAIVSDANQRRVELQHTAPWMTARG